MMKKIFSAVILLATISLSACSLLGVADCIWNAPVKAWVDENKNGQWDPDEDPVEHVTFQVDDIKNDYVGVGTAVSDWNGEAEVVVWLPGCPSAKFEVKAIPPIGYSLNENEPIRIQGKGYGNHDLLLFPMTREEGFPTPTQYLAKFDCIKFPLRAEEIELAPDGSVWIVSWDEVNKFEQGNLEWKSFPIDNPEMNLPEDIEIGNSGSVWTRSYDAIAELVDDNWEIQSLDYEVFYGLETSIGSTQDGLIWFAVNAPPRFFASYNPTNSTWTLYGPESRLDDQFRVELFRVNDIWYALFKIDRTDEGTNKIPHNKWNRVDTQVIQVSTENVIPISGWISDMEIDEKGIIWISHSYGISSFDPEKNTWEDLEYIDPAGLSNSFSDIAIGPDHSIWGIYSSNHPTIINLIPNRTDQMQNTWISYDPRDGIPGESSIQAIEADSVGNIWLGYGSERILTMCKKLE